MNDITTWLNDLEHRVSELQKRVAFLENAQQGLVGKKVRVTGDLHSPSRRLTEHYYEVGRIIDQNCSQEGQKFVTVLFRDGTLHDYLVSQVVVVT